MLLTFRKQMVLPIMRGTKIHTIREDKHDRWKAGMIADMWCHNPRNTHLNPFKFGISEIIQTRKIVIDQKLDMISLGFGMSICKTPLYAKNYEFTSRKKLDEFAINDGFLSWDEMKKFFPEKFKGKLIFWNKNIQFLKTSKKLLEV